MNILSTLSNTATQQEVIAACFSYAQTNNYNVAEAYNIVDNAWMHEMCGVMEGKEFNEDADYSMAFVYGWAKEALKTWHNA